MRGAEASLLALQSRVLPHASDSGLDLPPFFEGALHTPSDAESSGSGTHSISANDNGNSSKVKDSNIRAAAANVFDASHSETTWIPTNSSDDDRFGLFHHHHHHHHHNAIAGPPAVTTLTYSHHAHIQHPHHHHHQQQQQHVLTPDASHPHGPPVAHPTPTSASAHPLSPAAAPTLAPSSPTFLPQTAYVPGLEDLLRDVVYPPFDLQHSFFLPPPAYPAEDGATRGMLLPFGVPPSAASFQTSNGGGSSSSSNSGREEGARSGRSSCSSSPNSALEVMDKDRLRQLKAALRKERNKEAARRSNLNKKIIRHQLEQRSTELWEENLQLHQDIRDLSSKLRHIRHVCSTIKHVCRTLAPSPLVPLTSCR